MTSAPHRTPRVSVIVRTKDRIGLLQRAFASIAAQSFGDIEVIVVNDGGSPEPVDELIRSTFGPDGGFPVTTVHNPESHGRAGAINDGRTVATAPLYVLHDDDDAWTEDFLEITVGYLDAHPERVGVATRSWVVHERLVEGTFVEVNREVFAADSHAVTLIDTARNNAVPPIALLIRAEAADRAGGYDPDKAAMQDWDLLLRLLHLGPVGFIDGEPHALWYHRVDAPGALSNSVYGDQSAHRAFAPAIRDEYARHDTALGDLLAAGRYTNQLEGRINDVAGLVQSSALSHAEHLEVLFAQLTTGAAGPTMQDLHDEVRALRREVAEARERRPGRRVARALRAVQRRLDRGGRAPTSPPAARAQQSGATEGPSSTRWLDGTPMDGATDS